MQVELHEGEGSQDCTNMQNLPSAFVLLVLHPSIMGSNVLVKGTVECTNLCKNRINVEQIIIVVHDCIP